MNPEAFGQFGEALDSAMELAGLCVADGFPVVGENQIVGLDSNFEALGSSIDRRGDEAKDGLFSDFGFEVFLQLALSEANSLLFDA